MRVPLMVAAAALSVLGCTPADEWRELRPEGTTIAVRFPCKPDRHGRDVRIAGHTVRMDLLVCDAQGVTFGLAVADLGDPTAVTPALDELRAAAIGNMTASPGNERPLVVPGMTPNPRAVRLVLAGKPGGKALQEQVGFFVHGLRVYQATVVGVRLPDALADEFFGGLRVLP